MNPETSDRNNYNVYLTILLVIALAAGFLFKLGGYPLTDRDEGEFSEITREMFERDDFISIFVNDKPSYDKPILIYWCQAASMYIFGITEFAFRLPSAIFAILWMLTLVRFGREIGDRETGLAAGIMGATSLWIMLIGRAAIADALLNLLITLSMLDIWRWRQREGRLLKLRIFLWIGLGFLTKGPIAIIIPFFVTLIDFGLRRDWKRWLRLIFDPVGILILLDIALPWYVMQYLRQGQDFIDGFFGKHNVSRFTNVMEGHGGGVFYYFPFSFLLIFPYTTIFGTLIGKVKSLWRDDFGRFGLIWFGFVFLFFTIAATKLPHYILYGYSPVLILMAIHRNRVRKTLALYLPLIIVALIVISVPFILEIVRPLLPENQLQLQAMLAPENTAGSFDTGYLVWTSFGAMLALFTAFIRRIPSWQRLCLAGVLFAILIFHIVIPAATDVYQGPIVRAAQWAKQNDVPVNKNWGLDNPSFSVYREAVTVKGEPQPGEIVLTNLDRIMRQKPEQYQILYQDAGIVIARLEENFVHQRK